MKAMQRCISLILVFLLICSISTVAFADSGNTILTTSVPATITYEANGGSGTMEAVSVDVGTEYTLPGCGFTAPRGKVFRCWSIGTRRYEPGDTITVNSHVTVSAVWQNRSGPGSGSASDRVQELVRSLLQIIRDIFFRWF